MTASVDISFARGGSLVLSAPGNTPGRGSQHSPDAYRSRSGPFSPAIPTEALTSLRLHPSAGSSLLLSGTGDVAGGSFSGSQGRGVLSPLWTTATPRHPFRIG